MQRAKPPLPPPSFSLSAELSFNFISSLDLHPPSPVGHFLCLSSPPSIIPAPLPLCLSSPALSTPVLSFSLSFSPSITDNTKWILYAWRWETAKKNQTMTAEKDHLPSHPPSSSPPLSPPSNPLAFWQKTKTRTEEKGTNNGWMTDEQIVDKERENGSSPHRWSLHHPPSLSVSAWQRAVSWASRQPITEQRLRARGIEEEEEGGLPPPPPPPAPTMLCCCGCKQTDRVTERLTHKPTHTFGLLSL